MDELTEFIDALERFLQEALSATDVVADYYPHAVQIVDVRNHLFRLVQQSTTDEESSIYAVRELCRIDEQTLRTRPDRQRLASIGRACGLAPLL